MTDLVVSEPGLLFEDMMEEQKRCYKLFTPPFYLG